MKTIGVLGLQGAVSEHISSIRKLNCRPLWINTRKEFQQLDALILPGGESTSISKLLLTKNMFEDLIALGKAGLPIYGGCAGAVLLAKKGGKQVEKTRQRLLKLMDMEIDRNSFGGQRESFEAELEIDGITDDGKGKMNGVFIRAPIIKKVFKDCVAISYYEGRIVAARQRNFLATSFHPELTDDLRVHRYFKDMIQ